MLEKYYHDGIASGHSCVDGEHCWMKVESSRLVYVTATVVICRGPGVADGINGKIVMLVHANVKECFYRVRFEDTKLGECTVNAESSIVMFADNE